MDLTLEKKNMKDTMTWTAHDFNRSNYTNAHQHQKGETELILNFENPLQSVFHIGNIVCIATKTNVKT